MKNQINQRTTKSANQLPAINNKDQKQVEQEFIDNLKKQIYFMEMELRLMKEREKESI